MKKIFLATAMFFAMQIGFAQSQDAQTFITNLGIKAQLDTAKEGILPDIQVGKEEDFKKEFDTTVNEFIGSFGKLVDESFNMDEVKLANKKFAETKELTKVLPKDAVAFQEKVGTLQNELGMTLQGLVMKYANEEALQQAEE